jgi:putative intracellular protease/amidase
MAHVLIPIPSLDFDPTEVGVSWRVLTRLGHRVTLATPDGKPGACDPMMLTGEGLDPWARVPVLRSVRCIGQILRANADGRRAYGELTAAPSFQTPQRWDGLQVDDFDGLLLGGGHRKRGMRQFLESETLQRLVAAFFAADKPVSAICHGVVLAARSKTAAGKSVLFGRRTTALTWKQERTASQLAHVGRSWDRDYYRTYLEEPGEPAGFRSVQQEVTRALARPADFVDVPPADPDFLRKTSGLWRDTLEDARPAWVVQDGNYISARWPGDAHTFAKTFASLLG